MVSLIYGIEGVTLPWKTNLSGDTATGVKFRGNQDTTEAGFLRVTDTMNYAYPRWRPTARTHDSTLQYINIDTLNIDTVGSFKTATIKADSIRTPKIEIDTTTTDILKADSTHSTKLEIDSMYPRSTGVYIKCNPSGDDFVWIDTSGNVGIGEVEPEKKLSVNGDIECVDISSEAIGATTITATSINSSTANFTQHVETDSITFGNAYLKTYIDSTFVCTLKTSSVGAYLDHTTAYYTKIGNLVSITMETMTGSHTTGSNVAMALTNIPSELQSPRAFPYNIIVPVVSNSNNENGKIEIYNDGTADLLREDGTDFATGTGGIGYFFSGVGIAGTRYINITYTTY